MTIFDRITLSPEETPKAARPNSPETASTQELFYRTLGRHPGPKSNISLTESKDKEEQDSATKRFTLEFARVASPDKAEVWLDRLKESGVSGFYTPVHQGNRIWFKVRSGIFKNRQAASQVQSSLKQKLQIDSQVIEL
ncbi:MAG: SPOR domain-containing protein [Deltaproteobacteria bacterium]|nr:SPOR domain-containing protein [Deltaproteobacteria bacterium]